MSYFGLGRPALTDPGDGSSIPYSPVITVVPEYHATGAVQIDVTPTTDPSVYTKYILIGAAVLVALLLVRR